MLVVRYFARTIYKVTSESVKMSLNRLTQCTGYTGTHQAGYGAPN
jgi:hypothetical protein